MNYAVSGDVRVNKTSMKLSQLFEGITVTCPANAESITITGFKSDSRQVKSGDLFFAVPGYSEDGIKYIPEALSLGAMAVVTEVADYKSFDVPVIVCPDIRLVMSQLAARFFDYPSTKLNVIGITGTNGKTTISFLIKHIMEKRSERWGKIGTIDYDTGQNKISAINTTPGAIEIHGLLSEMVENGMNGCVVEVSSHGIDQKRCEDIQFSSAVFTNLTQDHLDYHKDMDSYFGSKARLFSELLKSSGTAILNYDDSRYEQLASLVEGNSISYSVDLANKDKTDLLLTDNGLEKGRRYFDCTYGSQKISSYIPLLGKFNLQNAAAAITAAIANDISLSDAVEALKDAPQVPGRVELVSKGQPFEIIIDYAHTPDALENLLCGLETDGRKIVVFGCGGDRDRAKRPLMGQIATENAAEVIITSDNPRTENPSKIIEDIIKGLPSDAKYQVLEKRDKAIREALQIAENGDLVIIAGKGHEDYQVVGSTRHYFSDPQVVISCLKDLGYDGD